MSRIMSLPASFSRDGFSGIPTSRFRGLMIGTEGAANTGKTEFAWSAPGPAIHLALDRGHRATLENPDPPTSRCLVAGESLVVQPIECPLNTGVTREQALASWRLFYQERYIKALHNGDVRTVILDGDSDSFEWQMLAEFGRTNQIPQIQRTALNASRRVMIARAADSGKIYISSNKLKKKYEAQFKDDGTPIPDPQKPDQQLREWDGKSYERQGFNDHEYCYELQLRHLYARPYTDAKGNDKPGKWGVQILMCKANRALEGDELWGSDCNLPTLLEYIYPHIGLAEWGY